MFNFSKDDGALVVTGTRKVEAEVTGAGLLEAGSRYKLLNLCARVGREARSTGQYK